MTRRAGRFCLMLALGLTGATAVVGTGAVTPAAAGPTDGSEVVVTRVPAPERQAASDYWTPDRLAAAEPLDVVLEASGTTSQVGGVKTFAEKVPKPYTTKSKRVTGAVFFKLPGSSLNFRCSGTAVQGETEPVVWSAGHCVYNAPRVETCNDPPDEPPGPCTPQSGVAGPVENLVFVPGYRSSSADIRPFGTFPAVERAVDASWQDIGNFRFDFGAFTVDTNTEGQSLEDVVGTRPLTTGYELDPAPKFKAIGYPAVDPYAGNAQFRCKSDLRGQDPLLGEYEVEQYVIGAAPDGLPGPDPLRIKCDMTGGSSGGGWRLGTAVGSNVSYTWGIEPGRMFGPYLGAEALALLNSIS